jgi:hypothetical protein
VLASIQEILKDAYKENYIVIGILYKILHANHDKTDMTTFYSPKKQRKNYNRMFMFGSFDGTCFWVIAENKHRAKAMMIFCAGNSIGVGQPLVLIEPKQVPRRQYLRKDMPVLEISLPCLPVQTNITPCCSSKRYILPTRLRKLLSSPCMMWNQGLFPAKSKEREMLNPPAALVCYATGKKPRKFAMPVVVSTTPFLVMCLRLSWNILWYSRPMGPPLSQSKRKGHLGPPFCSSVVQKPWESCSKLTGTCRAGGSGSVSRSAMTM